MNALNYRQPIPTWEVLQRQYTQPGQPVSVPVMPPQTGLSPGMFFAGLATAGSLLVLFGKSNKAEKAVAMKVLGVAAPVVLGKLFQIQ